MTVAELLREAERRLAERGVDETSANAEWLMARALGCGRPEVLLRSGEEPGAARESLFRRLVDERGRRVPLAYLLGTQPFLDLELEVGPAVLVPRPETEELARAAAERVAAGGSGAPRILDIGTGSGCLALALARRFPEARVVATDASPEALEVARRNAVRHGCAGRVQFVQEDVLEARGRRFGPLDLLVSNPPYIPSAEVDSLSAEVLREPRAALDGRPDGLRFIRAIGDRARAELRPGGLLALEVACGQATPAAAELRARGFRVETGRDAQGVERFVFAVLLIK